MAKFDHHIENYKTLNSFAQYKIDRLNAAPPTMRSLYELMFSERSNVMFEQSRGYRIVKTTYGECKDNIERKATTLKAVLGDVPPDSVVGVYMDNGTEWIETFWAVLLCGCRPLLLNLRLDTLALEDALKRMNAVLVISDGKTFDCVKTVNVNDIAAADNMLAYDELGTEIFVMSSGTSASVKVCGYTAKQFIEQVRDSMHIIKQNPRIKRHCEGNLKLLAFLPFYHIFGLVAVYIWFGFFSRTFVKLNDLSPDTILNTIRRHKVTHIFAVPLFWDTVYKKAIATIKGRGDKTYKKFVKGLKLAGVPMIGRLVTRFGFKEVRDNLFGDSVKFTITGGSAVSAEVLRFFNAAGYPLANGYGMTEIGITSVELSPKFKLLTNGSVGTTLPSVEYKISDDGELLVKGRSVSHEIIESGGATVIGGGYYNTHDLAECKNGRYYILGRKDDLIVGASGENLNPNLVEPKLTFDGVTGVCIVAGETSPALLVGVSRFADKAKLTALLGEIKARLAELNMTGQIGNIVFVGEPLLKGDEFKLNRRRLRAEYLAGKLVTVDPNTLSDSEQLDELQTSLRAMFAVALGKDAGEVAVNADFFVDCGGTSLDYYALVAAVQNEFGVTLPQGDGMLTTVKSMSEHIKGKL